MSRIGCHKMTFDVTKVTYNMYSCAISCMGREMIETDGRDSAKCQNWGKKGHRCHLEILNEEKDKTSNSVVFSNCKRSQKREENQKLVQ